jgi:hypothetical protein
MRRRSLVLAATVMLGCAGGNPEGGSPGASSGYVLRFGEGGGITGLWSGYTIEADGRLLHWAGRSEGANAEEVGRIDAASRAAFWSTIVEGGVLDLESQETGNLTRTITVIEDDAPHTVRWALGPAQTALDRVYGELVTRAEHEAGR